MTQMLPDSFTPEYLRQLELLRLRSRRAFLGSRQGGHISLKRGHGIEFSDYRKYELGDDPRHIDWNVYARSERLYVKRFQEEQDLSVFIIIDASRSMLVPPEDRKWERACELALTLAYIALLQQDRVSISVPGVLYTPLYSGAAAFGQICKKLMQVEPDLQIDLTKAMQTAVSRVRFPGVAIFISDLLLEFSELETVFNLLRAKNLDITALQLLGPNDLNPVENRQEFIAVDSESGEEVELILDQQAREEYRELLDQHNQKLRNFFLSSQINYALARSNDALTDFVINELSGKVLLE